MIECKKKFNLREKKGQQHEDNKKYQLETFIFITFITCQRHQSFPRGQRWDLCSSGATSPRDKQAVPSHKSSF